VNIHKL